MSTENIRSQKQQKLEKIIRNISTKFPENDKEIEYIISELQEIYSGEYRHDYSVFFPLLYDLGTNDSKSSIEMLQYSLIAIKDFIDKSHINNEDGSYEPEYKKIIKLIDHLNLEAARIVVELKSQNQIDEAELKVKNITDAYQKVEDGLERAVNKAEKAQKEFISILSIFAAVVLFFTIDSNYFTNAMAGMNNSSVFKIVFVVCVCGIVLINGFYLLFDFIKKILYNDNSDTEKNSKIGKRLQNKPILYVNILIIAIMIMDVVSWWLKIHNYFPFN